MSPGLDEIPYVETAYLGYKMGEVVLDKSKAGDLLGGSVILNPKDIPIIEGFLQVGGKEVGSDPILSYSYQSGEGPAGPWMIVRQPSSYLENNRGEISTVYEINNPTINKHIDDLGIDKERLLSIGVYSVTYELEYIPFSQPWFFVLMKYLLSLAVVFPILLVSLYCSEKDPLVRHIYGDAGVVLNDALEAASEGDLDLLKKSLSRAYLETVSAVELENVLKRSRWDLKEFMILSVYEFEDYHCFVVKFSGESQRGGEDLSFQATVPVFVNYEAGEWMLWNFPFAPSIVRNFPNERFCLSPLYK